jgi:hypothetical protein
MVVWFNVEEARNFLLENGYVYTLRPVHKKEGVVTLMYDKKEQGEVFVEFIFKVESIYQLLPYVKKSGFSSIDEWLYKAGDDRFLYLVTKEFKLCVI